MPKMVDSLLDKYLIEIKRIYGKHLKSVILYGSYARGDYTADSDVDIMILVDLKEDEIEKYLDDLSEVDYEYNVTYDIWIMPIVKNIEHFHYWSSSYQFYKNVCNEGVTLYEAA
jgi:predicted nucleotidyltransferase